MASQSTHAPRSTCASLSPPPCCPHARARLQTPPARPLGYLPEEILRLCKRRRGPLWLHVEDAYVPVKRTDDVLLFACEVAAAYHEGVARNVPREDWFRAEMQQIEDEVQRRLAEPDSENEADDPE